MPPPPDGPIPDELRGDDADTTPESSEGDEEEKPKQPLRRRKKLQDIMQSEKEIAANEIFKMFDDRDDDFDVNVNGEFDQDKWISEMLDTEDDPPPPPDEPSELTPTKSHPRNTPDSKKAAPASKKTKTPAKDRAKLLPKETGQELNFKLPSVWTKKRKWKRELRT